MKMNNKGLSVVEMVVVISIMAVLSGMIAIGLGSVFSKPADECAEKVYNAINNTRLITMGKNEASIEISTDGTYIYVTEKSKKLNNTEDSRRYPVSEKNVKVEYALTGEGTDMWTTLTSASPIILSYNRASGAFKPKSTAPEGDIYYERLRISKGSKERIITLYSNTGKVSID